ncbi:S-adenosyl-L-methionine-dependent methyltransferase [Obba rivulosa]|uniref:Cytosine-specific methyltransferase n=1 Tax=Obba rivulosa TaxID=1052685 RepID=A0A8E2J3G2_9APHY|nr:S-adenosyl-L-methionine-dependent methyltransferase [Obba rivulosa]
MSIAHGQLDPPLSPSTSFWVEIPVTTPVEKDFASSLGGSLYQPLEDEIDENDDLHVPGETTPGSGDEDDDVVPVRKLVDFFIYERQLSTLVPLEDLLGLEDEDDQYERDFCASGIVIAHKDEDQEDAEELSSEDIDLTGLEGTEKMVKLTRILEFNVHWVTGTRHGNMRADPLMYIRTKYAWYILDTPAAAYLPFYKRYWLKHRLLHLVVSTCLDDTEITYSAFVDSLRTDKSARTVLGRNLREADLDMDDVRKYVRDTLEELCEDPKLRRVLTHVPLVRSICGHAGRRPKHPGKPGKSVRQGPHKRLKDVEKDVLQHRNKTVVMPIVGRIAQQFFAQSQAMHVAGHHYSRVGSETGTRPSEAPEYVHDTDPTVVEWDEDSAMSSSTSLPKYYESVFIDGVRYSIGDIVLVEQGEDSNTIREKNAASQHSRSRNSLANTKWFCKICYMYEKEEVVKSGTKRTRILKKFFHAQWLQHGSQTLLQETAHSKALFWLNECDDLAMECIFGRCNVHILGSADDEPLDDGEEENDFFTNGLTWDPGYTAFVQVSNQEMSSAMRMCNPEKQCFPCGLKVLRKEQAMWKFSEEDQSLSQWGTDYHVSDFVYLRIPSGDLYLYQIAEIVDIDPGEEVPRVRACLYGRHDLILRDLEGDEAWSRITDNRRLFATPTTIEVEACAIEGKAYIKACRTSQELDEWLQDDDHYYVDLWAQSLQVTSLKGFMELDRSSTRSCARCLQAHIFKQDELSQFTKQRGPLRALDLFSGAGGLSTGLNMSKSVDTKWAVEFSPSAALSYEANHPNTIVYNQCTNLLLQHTIDTLEGKKPGALRSLSKKEERLSPMPKPGEVDFIFGGPPCQSFSLMNHSKKADDIRSTLVCNMLSWVELYRPPYFLIENVIGMLFHPLGGKQSGRSLVGGIKMGIVKFIVRASTALGYQIHFRVLQAGQYGAPQGRRRLIFEGARRDLALPQFPAPTHCFPKRTQRYNLPTGDILQPVTRCPIDEDDVTTLEPWVPLPTVTVMDAIGDLPRFDWTNPHQELRPTQADLQEARDRKTRGIPSFNAVTSSCKSLPGFVDPSPYSTTPLSRYQAWVRDGGGEEVEYQYSRTFQAGVVERVVNIPFEADADHVHLPRALQVPRLFDSQGHPKSQYRGQYGRINGNGHFWTAMTTIMPNAKGGRVLHPTQKRIITVRECARAQGFPDRYRFLSVNSRPSDIMADQLRQIGNAVPVPLALALGKEIGKAYFDMSYSIASARDISPEL